MNIITAVENAVVAAWHVVVNDVTHFGAIVIKDAVPVMKAVEATVYSDLRAVIGELLVASQDKSNLADVETALLNVLSAAKSALLADAQALGSDVLQVIIADVRGS